MYSGIYERENRIARTLIWHASRVLLSNAIQDIEFSEKKNGEPVTPLEVTIERYIRSELQRGFPNDGFLGEETGEDSGRMLKQRVWILDPIDDTAGFIQYCRASLTQRRNYARFSIVLGLIVDHVPVMGIAYFPHSGLLYYGEQGALPCAENDFETRSIHASDRYDLEGCRFVISSRNPGVQAVAERNGCSVQLIDGIAARMLSIASGENDFTYSKITTSKEWDLCGVYNALVESGCIITDADGNPDFIGTFNKREVYNQNGVCVSNGPTVQAHREKIRQFKGWPGAPL